MLATWPFADLSYADDFAYSDVALKLSQTGHFIYNSWEFAMLLAHAWWGTLFIRVFGFSFECLRFSTIPFSLGSVAICYLLVRRAGLRPPKALFVTLLLGLSPLFLPLSISYMTDIPCLCFTLASLYSLSRAAEASRNSSRYGWLALGAAAGLVGGTGRQVVWLVPLVVLPYLTWIKRRQLTFAAASASAWTLVALCAGSASAWFNRQPYVAHARFAFGELKLTLNRPLWEINLSARLALMLLLVILPAALPLVFEAAAETWRGGRSRQIFTGILLLAVIGAVLVHPSLASIPWVNSTLNWEGINGTAPLPGRPVVLTTPIRAVVALTVYACVCILAGELWKIRRLSRRIWKFLADPPPEKFALAAMSFFSVLYLALLIIRGSEIDLFDRYLLPVMPWAATLVLLWSESESAQFETRRRGAMAVAWALLAIMAAYGLLSTQDLWSLARARGKATKKLETAGVPRTAIDAGMEYNGWTQLLVTGQMNDRWVPNPSGAYRPQYGTTPEVIPIYRLEYVPTPETAPSEFGSVPYFSLLPPFHKQVSIDHVRNR